MLHIAFGPITPNPSWSWVGSDIAAELSRRGIQTSLFQTGEAPTTANVWVFVKQPARIEDLERARRHMIETVYQPVDFYSELADIKNDPVLPLYNKVISHSRELAVHLADRARSVSCTEHHVKFGLSEIRPWREPKPDDRILYVGQALNVPSLLEWLKQHDPDNKLSRRLNVMTDPSHVARYHNMPYIKFSAWSEREHLSALGRVATVIDIKGTSFNQRMKPPTKAQQYVWSGIPLAMNPDSSSAAWFREEGLDIAHPLDEARWFSRAYYDEIVEASLELRQNLTVDRIADRLLKLLG